MGLGDVLGRWVGGDEFLVLLDAAFLAARLALGDTTGRTAGFWTLRVRLDVLSVSLPARVCQSGSDGSGCAKGDAFFDLLLLRFFFDPRLRESILGLGFVHCLSLMSWAVSFGWSRSACGSSTSRPATTKPQKCGEREHRPNITLS